MNLKAMSHQELFTLFADIGVELRERGLCRSGNSPVADLAEVLVARALGLELATNSTAGYDAKDEAGTRYQIKARRQVPGRGPPHPLVHPVADEGEAHARVPMGKVVDGTPARLETPFAAHLGRSADSRGSARCGRIQPWDLPRLS
jgi:hypothetical protein